MRLPRLCGGKEPSCQCRRLKRRRFDPWVRKIPGEGKGNTLQYFCLENSMDRRASWATVHGVAKIQTGLCDFHSLTIIIIKPHFYSIKYASINPSCIY